MCFRFIIIGFFIVFNFIAIADTYFKKESFLGNNSFIENDSVFNLSTIINFKSNSATNTSLIQKVLDDSSLKFIYIPKGLYNISYLHIKRSVRIIAEKGAVFKMQKAYPNRLGANISILSCKNVIIDNLCFDLSNAEGNIYAGTSSILIQNSSNITVKNCRVLNSKYAGIVFRDSCNNLLFKNNYIFNTDTGILGLIYKGKCSNVHIESNNISNGTSEGITVDRRTRISNVSNLSIVNNKISYKNDSFGISIHGVDNVNIDRNFVQSCRYGISLSEKGPYEFLESRYVDVTYNSIINCNFGIKNIGSYTTIRNNVFKNIDSDVLFTDSNLNRIDHLLIFDNLSSNYSRYGGRGGMILRNVYNSLIFKNTFRNNINNNFGLKVINCDSLYLISNKFMDSKCIISNSSDLHNKVFFKENIIKNVLYN